MDTPSTLHHIHTNTHTVFSHLARAWRGMYTPCFACWSCLLSHTLPARDPISRDDNKCNTTNASPHGGRGRGHTQIRQITADTCTDEISSSRTNRNLLLPLIFDGNVLCRYAQGERKRIRLACHPAHAHAHMSDSLLRKMLRRKNRAHRPHMMQQHTKTLKGTDDRYIDKL